MNVKLWLLYRVENIFLNIGKKPMKKRNIPKIETQIRI